MVMEDFLGLPFESMLCKTIAASTPHMQFIVVTEVGYIIVFTRRESYLTVGVSVLSSGRIYLYSDLNSENIVDLSTDGCIYLRRTFEARINVG